MDNTALRSISNPKFLNSVWRDMYGSSHSKRRDTAGIDDISLNNFKANEVDQIKKISKALRNRSYHPLPLEPFFIKKANGKTRVICVPTVPDRLVQRAILQFLNANGCSLDNEVSYGFIKNKSVKKAASAAKELRKSNNWAYKTDISAFFDNINRDTLKATYKKKIPFKSLYWLFDRIIETEIACIDRHTESRINELGITKGLGIRQGMPLSPMFANVMLAPFDSEIIKRNLKMVRYADDFVVLEKSKEACLQTHEICKIELEKLGLSIPDLIEDSKTAIYGPDDVVDFLGLGLHGATDGFKIGITSKQKKAIKKKFFEYVDVGLCLKKGIYLSRLLQRINGLITAYRSAYDVVEDFNAIGNYLLDMRKLVFAEIFKKINVDINSLSKSQKKFLEIDF